MNRTDSWYATIAVAAFSLSIGVTACGDDDDSSGGQTSTGGSDSSAAGSGETPNAAGDQARGGSSNPIPGAGGDASGGASPGSSSCTATVIGSWKAGGVSYESQTGLYVGLDAKFNFTMTACGGSDATMEFETIPKLEVGSYPLTFTILHGKPANGDGGAVFLQGKGGNNYFTDDAHTGTFNITAVDMAAKKFSADFEFSGKADDGKTLEITDGHIIDAPFQTQ